ALPTDSDDLARVHSGRAAARDLDRRRRRRAPRSGHRCDGRDAGRHIPGDLLHSALLQADDRRQAVGETLDGGVARRDPTAQAAARAAVDPTAELTLPRWGSDGGEVLDPQVAVGAAAAARLLHTGSSRRAGGQSGDGADLALL